MLPLNSTRYILIVSVYLHRKSLKFVLFLLIFRSLSNVIYLKCNLKDVLEVVAIISGDTAKKLLK